MSLPPITMKVGSPEWDEYKKSGRLPVSRNVGQRERLVIKQTPRREMNATECAYATVLETKRLAGEISFYEFEGVSVRLAPGSRYKPDFFVVTLTGLECHEVKGPWREAARVRIKVAAAKYPMFKFIAVSKIRLRDGGGWKVEEF